LAESGADAPTAEQVRFGVVFERRLDRYRRQRRDGGKVEHMRLVEPDILVVHHPVQHRIERAAIAAADGAGHGQQCRSARFAGRLRQRMRGQGGGAKRRRHQKIASVHAGSGKG
jgi:hypothetical protein